MSRLAKAIQLCWWAALITLTLLVGAGEGAELGLELPPALALLAPSLKLLLIFWGSAAFVLPISPRAPSISGCLLAALLLLQLITWRRAEQDRGAPPSPSAPRLRLLSWNVGRLGESARQRSIEIPRRVLCAKELLAASSFDALALQEISARRLAELQVELALRCRQVDYLGTGALDLGGLAICVPREGPWRLRRSRSLPLRGEWHALFGELYQGSYVVNLLSLHLPPPRLHGAQLQTAVRALAAGESSPLEAFFSEWSRATHAQLQETAALLERIAHLEDPTILAGDFNSAEGSLVHQRLRESWLSGWRAAGSGLGATRWLGWLPLRIDHIYLSRSDLYPEEVEIIESGCSDHLPLSATLIPRRPISGEAEETSSLVDQESHEPGDPVQ